MNECGDAEPATLRISLKPEKFRPAYDKTMRFFREVIQKIKIWVPRAVDQNKPANLHSFRFPNAAPDNIVYNFVHHLAFWAPEFGASCLNPNVVQVGIVKPFLKSL